MLISLTGPSGIGKDYIKQALLRHFATLQEVIWLTTRLQRPNEEAGRCNREPINDDTFNLLMSEGQIVFHQELYGHQYGLRREGAWFSNQGLWITEFHIDNLAEARKICFGIKTIGLIPHDIKLLESRLERRATESLVERRRRLDEAEDEIGRILANKEQFDRLLVITPENEGVIGNIAIGLVSEVLEVR